MKITLKSISLRNFKAIKNRDLVFGGQNTVISGANATGKTTIYEAYYWCLFGKTLTTNGIVQTLDKNNEILHKIDTIVEVVLIVNDEYDVKIRRTLVEKWKAENTPDEQFTGTEMRRFWNDVPVSMAVFKSKLEELVPITLWQLLSNNFAFMGYKMEDRRKMLMSVAGEIDEEELIKPYPAIQEAIRQRKSIDELNTQTKRTRKEANKELTEIPAKISAQDALKVDTANNGTENANKVEEYFKSVAQTQEKIESYRHTWEKQHGDNVTEIRHKVFAAQDEARKVSNAISQYRDEQEKRIKRLATVTDEFNRVKIEWQKVNEEQFDFKQSDLCPVCKQPLPKAYKKEEYANVVAEYNKHKSERLQVLMTEAQQLAEQKNVLQGAIKSYNEITKPKYDKEELSADKKVEELERELKSVQNATLDADKEYQQLTAELEALQSNRPANADDIVKIKADKEINKRVDSEKERLQKRSAELSQIIADCDNTLYQIFNYKKAKIDAVEDNVNGFFSFVRWKFFQQNITNDDLQEICTCVVNGVDYNNLNTASKVNASIDIINGISKATDNHVTLFIDNAESITDLLASDSQQIALKVKDNAPLEYYFAKKENEF